MFPRLNLSLSIHVRDLLIKPNVSRIPKQNKNTHTHKIPCQPLHVSDQLLTFVQIQSDAAHILHTDLHVSNTS